MVNPESGLPLSGVTVLDLTQVLAGPYATMLLADLGATVTKIEPPWGDTTRSWGPPWVGDESAYFLSVNRNKESIVLDLTQDVAREAFLALAADSDVVVENFKTGQMEKWDLGYESHLQDAFPHLIYSSISGFGETGPMAGSPGYATLIEALGGLMSLTGERNGAPVKVGVALVDVIAGSHAAIGILAALQARQLSGRGQRVNVSLLESQVSALVNEASNYFATGHDPERHGNAHPSIVPFSTFQAADRPVTVAVGNDFQFRRFSELLGHPEWADDERFATNSSRVASRVELESMVEEALAQAPAEYWVDAGRDFAVPISKVHTLSEVFAHPQVEHLGLVESTDHPLVGEVKSIRCPIRFGDTPTREGSSPPVLGADTERRLREIGLSEDEVSRAAGRPEPSSPKQVGT